MPEYVALAPAVRSAVESSYYAPHELSEARWERFWNDVDQALSVARTDDEVQAGFRRSADALGVSHLDLYRPRSVEGSGSVDTTPPVSLAFGDDGVAVLTVNGRFSVERTIQPVAEAFGRVAAENPRALVIDLRQNQGGDVSSMLLASHLIDSPAPAGLFLSRTWWDTHDAVPPPSEWSALPLLTGPDMDAFFGALDQHGALVGFVPPMQPHYGGPVYVLTGPRTASASEPLVYLLQSTGRATVVGQRTAGAMVSATTTELPGGWVLQHPIADYYTADGTRLDQVGVMPDVVVAVPDALDEARRLAGE
ncbi:S41 family peptidase [Rubrivirga sp. IMCC45206]|uniref:S41 family peptidase n=1 Tax=Rubrivirga sp. IMCC45206 TaxID=3391614 RepID=UPI00398FF315